MEKEKRQKGVKVDMGKLQKVKEQSGAKYDGDFLKKARLSKSTFSNLRLSGKLSRATLDKIELAYGLPEGYLDLKDEPPKAEADTDTANLMNVLISALRSRTTH